MAREYSERDLVQLFLNHTQNESFSPAVSRGLYHWDFEPEHTLPSGRRIDLIWKNRNRHDKIRLAWLLEFKVTVCPDAIPQALRYQAEFRRSAMQFSPGVSFKSCYVSLAGQYFQPDTLMFAERLGIQCLQVAPVNDAECTIREILPFNKRTQFYQQWRAYTRG